MTKRQENTKNFLQSYRIRKAFSQVSGYDESEDMSTSVEIKSAPPAPFDLRIERGQIRLLSQPREAVWVLVLKKWENASEMWLVSTFSDYDFPATDEEVMVGKKVVQAWNTRTLFKDLLEKSWVSGNLPESQIRDVFDLWAHAIDDREIPDTLWERTGAPIEDQPVETQREIGHYMAESLAKLAEVDEMDLEMN